MQASEAASGYLSAKNLGALPASIEGPSYGLDDVQIGIAHLGPGAFHRAHQAWFFDDALAKDPRWAISAISLQRSDLRDALAPQDGLYTAVVLDERIRHRVIGALRERLVAPLDSERVIARMASETTRIVSMTITEKGYCLGADGTLDFSHADIRRDIAAPRAPVSAIGYLVEALRRRRAAGIAAFTSISCDNLSDNGGKLARAVSALAACSDPDLARWIEHEAAFPRTMVDSIVPATSDALKQRVADALGVQDRWPVQREAFAQWVIEDRFCNLVPEWAALGVTITNDVDAFERAKLCLLNGAHSTLSYLGLLIGHATVAQAVGDARLAAFVEHLMRVDIQPTLRAPVGLNLDRYIADVLARFRNPNLQHALAQIAIDGSQKIPFRLLGTIRHALAGGHSIERLCVPIAAWLHFVRGKAIAGQALVDPLSEILLQTARAGDGSAVDVRAFVNLRQVFDEDLANNTQFVATLARRYERLSTLPVLAAIED